MLYGTEEWLSMESLSEMFFFQVMNNKNSDNQSESI